jgi:hypothetical protein
MKIQALAEKGSHDLNFGSTFCGNGMQAPASMADPLFNALPESSQLSVQRHQTLRYNSPALMILGGSLSISLPSPV